MICLYQPRFWSCWLTINGRSISISFTCWKRKKIYMNVPTLIVNINLLVFLCNTIWLMIHHLFPLWYWIHLTIDKSDAHEPPPPPFSWNEKVLSCCLVFSLSGVKLFAYKTLAKWCSPKNLLNNNTKQCTFFPLIDKNTLTHKSLSTESYLRRDTFIRCQ